MGLGRGVGDQRAVAAALSCSASRWPARGRPARRTARRPRRCPGSRRRRRQWSGTCAGRPSISASQSSTCVSSSVQAGLVAQSMPCTPKPGREQLAQDRRAGSVGGKKGKEVRRLPVRDAGHDDRRRRPRRMRLERLALLRRRGRQPGADLAGLTCDSTGTSRPAPW